MTAERIPQTDLFAELTDAIAVLRGFFETRADAALSASETRTLERLVDRYQRADAAVSQYVDGLIKRSTGRPRR
jgi:hypothetical protein